MHRLVYWGNNFLVKTALSDTAPGWRNVNVPITALVGMPFIFYSEVIPVPLSVRKKPSLQTSNASITHSIAMLLTVTPTTAGLASECYLLFVQRYILLYYSFSTY